ncbi:hypothetical protein KCTCHS21_37090 [Cohnella abietis]|uniref:ABC transporter domain-containing protein n=1 Tax=Cohnella abietis TaxID=2507935 RepID=A0A3T1D8A2_9BACL|nr:hypothetical protein KCTCHS21_37090 [Cohnella abietis]
MSDNGMSLQIKEGETVLLLGPSGSGKSTLALGLCGLIPHAVAGKMSGVVRIAGLDTRETEPGELARVVGTVFQYPDAQTVMMTVEDEIAFGLENIGVPRVEMEKRIREALKTVGLTVQGNQPVDQLSGGQKQRLTLSSVLAMEPDVLVLDEPTANLDPAGTAEVFHTLRRLKASGHYTIVLIEHKLDDLVDLVDRVIVIDKNGELVCSGAPESIFYDWAAELESLGVWFPQAVEIARKLQLAGVPIESKVLSMKQLAEALRGFEHSPRVGGEWNDAQEKSPDTSELDVTSTALHSHSSPPLLDIRPVGPPGRSAGWLRPIELQVRRGEFWAIVGENGAGKTTLARHIIGLLPVRPGVIFIDGNDAAVYPVYELARRIGFVFQNPEHQFVTERVWDEIAFSLKGMGLPEEEISTRVNHLLERFGLKGYADAHPFCLSHGQK